MVFSPVPYSQRIWKYLFQGKYCNFLSFWDTLMYTQGILYIYLHIFCTFCLKIVHILKYGYRLIFSTIIWTFCIQIVCILKYWYNMILYPFKPLHIFCMYSIFRAVVRFSNPGGSNIVINCLLLFLSSFLDLSILGTDFQPKTCKI